jgi:hypothetical protein
LLHSFLSFAGVISLVGEWNPLVGQARQSGVGANL